MAKIMDPVLPILSILGYWSIILGSFGGLGRPVSALALALEVSQGAHRC